MLIQKGGISRNIDPKNLQRYKDKGYAPVEQPAAVVPETPVPPIAPKTDPKAGVKDGSAGK